METAASKNDAGLSSWHRPTLLVILEEHQPSHHNTRVPYYFMDLRHSLLRKGCIQPTSMLRRNIVRLAAVHGTERLAAGVSGEYSSLETFRSAYLLQILVRTAVDGL